MSEIQRQPVSGPGVWSGEDFETDLSYSYQLTDAHLAELDQALHGVKSQGLSLPEISAAQFPLASLSDLLSLMATDLRAGRGFALLHGLPVRDYDYEDLERLYWGLCSHIGMGRTQNSDASFIHYVTTGERRPNQGGRGVGFPRKSPLHVDLNDIVSLLCVRQAPDDPPSWLASSLTLYNEILKRRPAGLDRLFEGFEWDRMGEHDAVEAATSGYLVPVFSQADGQMSCRYNRHWMQAAAARNDTPFGKENVALLDMVDEIAQDIKFEFEFHEGDMQFCSNYTVLHGRAAHASEIQDDRRRLLFRIWLDVPDFRAFSDEAVVRYGIGQHGQLGWTPAQMLSGANQQPRARRQDGAIMLA